MTSNRLPLALIAILSFAAVIIALLSQHVWGMAPCAWCVLQRLVYLLIVLAALAGLLVPRLAPAAAIVAPALAIAGALAAWYQYDVAANLFSCEQTFADKFMTASGLEASIPWLFGIYASCMDARVSLFGIEYAILSLILFIVIAALGLRALTPTNRAA